jgi:hypothetical protein
MFHDVLFIGRNVAAFTFAHTTSVKQRKAIVPQSALTSSITSCPTDEGPHLVEQALHPEIAAQTADAPPTAGTVHMLRAADESVRTPPTTSGCTDEQPEHPREC